MRLLIQAGADVNLRTSGDECKTAAELAPSGTESSELLNSHKQKQQQQPGKSAQKISDAQRAVADSETSAARMSETASAGASPGEARRATRSAHVQEKEIFQSAPSAPASKSVDAVRDEDDDMVLERLRSSPHASPILTRSISVVEEDLAPLNSDTDPLQVHLQMLQLKSELTQERKLRKQLQERLRTNSSGSIPYVLHS